MTARTPVGGHSGDGEAIMNIIPSGQTLGARIGNIDLADPLSDSDFRSLLRAH
jgi:hypothetical protein